MTLPRTPDAGPGVDDAWLRALIDDAPDFIEIVDAGGTIRYISPAIRDLAGYEPEELVGQPFHGFVHPDDLPKAEAALAQAVTTRELVRVTLRYRDKHGAWRVVEKQGRNYLDEPRIAGILVHTRDVTRHVQIERDLTETEQLYHSLVSAMAEGAVLQDASGAILACNPSAERILGATASQLRGSGSMDPRWRAIHEDGSPFPGQAHPAMVTLATGEPQSEVTMGIHKPDGTLTWISINTQPVLRPGTSVPHAVVSTFHDITRHRNNETALRHSADEVLDLYNNAPCGYHSLDRDGVFVRINDTELGWLGCTREEVIARRKFSDFLTPASRATFEKAFPRLVAHGSMRDVEYELVRGSGSRMAVLVSASAVLDGDGNYIMSRSTVYDITDRKQAEDTLKRVNRALRVLSDCNTALVHAQTQAALLAEVCRLLVESGGYRVAWVGFAEHDEARSIRPMAVHGTDADYIAQAHVSWGDDAFGQGPAGLAIRSGEAQVARDFSADPRMEPWRAQALARGFASAIALPLAWEGAVQGVLCMLSSSPSAFDAEEVGLLRELAHDLAYGIGGLRTREQHRIAEETVRHLAYFDTLTGLANRVQLQERLEHAVHEAGDSGHFCVLTINVERFREVQTGLGIRAADGLLQQIAMRLRQAATGELIARVTADEFAIFVEHDGTELATALAQRVHDVMNPPFEQAGVAIDVQVRIGAALYPDHGKDADTLLLHSAIAAREAASSPTHFAAYRGVSELQSTHRLELAAELRRAIPAGQLMLFYQPKIDVLRGVVCGVEALVRWAHPVRGMVRPDEFIGLAEHTGLIKPLTSWVIEAAMRQAARWQAEGMPLPIAINVSAVNLREPDFLDRLGELQLQTGCEPRLIQLEITETTLMQDPNSLDLLHRLKHMGIDIYIDDFGTGYSSLSYIATMPVHALKIDRSFVLNMTRKEEHRTVVAAAISLAHSLHLRVVGEGVETIQQAHELERLDCDELQGYLFARPLPPDELARWIGQFDPSAYELTRATPASS